MYFFSNLQINQKAFNLNSRFQLTKDNKIFYVKQIQGCKIDNNQTSWEDQHWYSSIIKVLENRSWPYLPNSNKTTTAKSNRNRKQNRDLEPETSELRSSTTSKLAGTVLEVDYLGRFMGCFSGGEDELSWLFHGGC